MVSLLVRYLCARKLAELRAGGPEAQQARQMELVQRLRESPIAVATEAANAQHYEVPAAFYQHVLGPHLKYSSGWWGPGVTTLAEAERAMLELYCERAQLEDGQDVLDLGCGWGSLSLFLARKYPRSRVLGVSNSASQREFILSHGLPNLEILTRNVATWEFPREAFDRIVSVEMLEHVRNYAVVFRSLREALRPGGKLFVHVFCHREFAYPFDGDGWMERKFFTGGLMPSRNLLLYFSEGMRVEEHWAVDGRHYERTARAWLRNLRAARREVLPLVGWRGWLDWQLFFLACAELFGLEGGREWGVTHLRFARTL